MGTNYFLRQPNKPNKLHIGKRSFGWTFALHVGDGAPDDLLGWVALMLEPGAQVEDEYAKQVPVPTMLGHIIDLPPFTRPDNAGPPPRGGTPGPRGLFRHANEYSRPPPNLDHTYDLVTGKFG